MILLRKLHVKHPFAGQNTQQEREREREREREKRKTSQFHLSQEKIVKAYFFVETFFGRE